MPKKTTILHLPLVCQFTICFWLAFPFTTFADIKSDTLRDTFRIKKLLRLSHQKWDENPYQAEDLALEALALARQMNYVEGEGKALARLGAVKWALGQYEKAIDCYLKALQLQEHGKDTFLLASIYSGLGLVYDELENYNLALQYHRKSLQIEKSLHVSSEEARCYNNMGAIYFDMQQYDSAVWYLERALNIRRAEQDTFGMAESYNNVGYTHFVNDEIDIALTNYFKALEIWNEIGGINGKTYTLKNIGQAYLKQENYTLAEKYLLESLEIGKSIDSRKWEVATLEVLKALEVSRKSYQQALAYDKVYDVLRDSLLNAEKTRQVAEMETRFETNKKEKEIALQEQKIKVLQQDQQIKTLWRNLLILLLALLCALAASIICFQQLKRRKDRQLFKTQQALAKVELENAHLKAQELDHALHVKNKELTSYSINFLQKNELMEEVKEQLNDLRKTSDHKLSRELRNLHRILDQNHHVDKEWEEFKLHFEQVHEGFFANLKESFPELTSNELKICALMRLNLNIKEMANILGIAPSSVKVARHRIRKKLKLEREESLADFVRQFDPNPAKDTALYFKKRG